MAVRRVYIGVVGVLLQRHPPEGYENDGYRLRIHDSRSGLFQAHYAALFVEFVVEHFQTYWLRSADDSRTLAEIMDTVTHRRGSRRVDPVLLDRIAPVTSLGDRTKLFVGDYYWLESNPFPYELDSLRSMRQLFRWLRVDVHERDIALFDAIDMLHAVDGT